jgi:hypothetical protein
VLKLEKTTLSLDRAMPLSEIALRAFSYSSWRLKDWAFLSWGTRGRARGFGEWEVFTYQLIPHTYAYLSLPRISILASMRKRMMSFLITDTLVAPLGDLSRCPTVLWVGG